MRLVYLLLALFALLALASLLGCGEQNENGGTGGGGGWCDLMRRGLDIDVLECPDCGGRLRFVAAILLSSAIRRILRHLGLPPDPVEGRNLGTKTAFVCRSLSPLGSR